MRRWSAVSFVLLLALSTAAIAEDSNTVRKQILADFNRAMVSLKRHDIKGFLAFVADDYAGNSQGMKVNKAYVEQTMKPHLDGTNTIHAYSYDIENLKVSGARATGKATFTLDSTVLDSQGMMGAKGSTHRMTYAQTFDTTWTRTGNHWQRSRETSIGQPRITVDGKPFNPMAPPAAPAKPAKPAK
jgi:hypothetical protein